MNKKESMSSRDRVRCTLEHEEPDRIPVDFGTSGTTSLSAIAYYNLKKFLGKSCNLVKIYDVIQQLAVMEPEMFDYFCVDVVDVDSLFLKYDTDWYNAKLNNGIRIQYPSWFKPVKEEDDSFSIYHEDGTKIARMPKTGHFFDQITYPFSEGYPADYDNIGDAISKIQWGIIRDNHKKSDDYWKKLREYAEKLHNKTDKALTIGGPGKLFEWGCYFRRLDRFCSDLIRQPNEVEKLLDTLVDMQMKILKKVCKTVGDLVDIIRFADDLGENNGPFMNPKIYKRMFKPRHEKLWKYARKHSSAKIFLHSCGSIKPLIPDLIDAGIDILNPVQISARDMDPQELKNRFGEDIVFWGGGADTTKILNYGTPSVVEKHVTKMIQIFSPRGGFVFNTVHNVLPDVPPENLIAMRNVVKNSKVMFY
ncbi:MAG: methyltransferase [Candidatus Lokiarchaeota archaeon]|nr:methyltransferase [Candidatus Lokiarchaeota archaeon]